MFEILQSKQWSGFCSTNNGRLVVGKNIRQTFLKQNGPHGLVAHPDSKWWWRNQGQSLPWIQDILQKQWPQGPYLSAGGNSFSSIWGGQCWIMEGLHSGWRSFGEIWGKKFSRIIKSHPSWIDCDWSHHERHCQRDVLVSPLHKGRLQHDLSQPRPLPAHF